MSNEESSHDDNEGNDNDDDDDEMEEAMEVEAVVEDDDDGDNDEDANGGQESVAVVQQASVLETAEEMPDNEDDEEYDQVEVVAADTARDGKNNHNAGDDHDDDEDDNNDDDDDDDDGDDGEEVLAAVVMEDDGADDEPGQEVVQVAAVVVPEAAPSSAAPKKSPRKRIKKKKSSGEANSSAAASTTGKSSSGKTKKRRKVEDDDQLYGTVPPERREAATDARAMLQDTVPTLPVAIAESQVRSFGRVFIEPNMHDSDYSSTIALYPIGFSCDRYEFSPVHGRLLKMRCSILSGRAIKEKQKTAGHAVSTELPNGPMFRVVWGQGVDDDKGDNVDYPFDLYLHAKSLRAGKSKSAAAEEAALGSTVTSPGVGMRVKVRFDKTQYYTGVVVKVAESKKRRKQVEISIRYDDGSSETAMYPDPDIALLMPGVENDIDAQGRVDIAELNGKPVTSVFGTSPLEAWGQVLTKLGLIDEIMFDTAVDSVKTSRADGFKEAKDKMEAKIRIKPRVENPPVVVEKSNVPPAVVEKSDDRPVVVEKSDGLPVVDGAVSPVPSSVNEDRGKEEKKGIEESEAKEESDEREPSSEKEDELRKRYEALLVEYEAAKEEDRLQSIALANARIRLLGHFLCNPFHDDDSPGKSQLSSWLITAVRKEKTRMGSTGNKKKIVTAVDLLERNDTFYNADIEALIEGLPGSEYCSSYVYQAFRSAGPPGLSRAWIHEAQLHREKEALQRQKRSREAQAKEQIEQEKEDKKRKREEDRDARKRLKIEEEDLKKKARIEERMSRLKIQVDDRLFEEATFQRGKTISALARKMTQEFHRRRRAAELVAGQVISKVQPLRRRGEVPSEIHSLPPLGKVYDEDAIRVWNFISTFGSFFLERGYISEVPTLDSLQAAVDCLRGNSTSPGSRMATSDAVSSLTELAVALCKPLAASLTRVLFASLIALNPVLQKDFGAAFFNEVNANASSKVDGNESSRPDVLLPVTAMTWQEIARTAFLSDALGELGYARHEAAHLLRGYRSSGHPNSKESRRLRTSEDFSIALLRQEIADSVIESEEATKELVRVDAPSFPSCDPSDFRFYLHNVNSLPETSVTEIRENLSKALQLFDSSETAKRGIEKSELESILMMLDKVGSPDQFSKADTKVLKNARGAFLKLLHKTVGLTSDMLAEKAASGKHRKIWPWQVSDKIGFVAGKDSASKPRRQRMGLINSLELTKAEYKQLSSKRELYMEEALRLKEEMKRKAKADDEEDDDDDEDDEDGNGVNAVVVTNGDGTQDDSKAELIADITENGESTVTDAKIGSGENGTKTLSAVTVSAPTKIGKVTEYDDFCADIPGAPELIRRCMAVLRTLSLTGPAEPFHYPVDPQTNPGYYDMVLRPMCLREVGKQLQDAAAKFKDEGEARTEIIEGIVAQFGRNVRLISQNCLSYANAGPTVISAGSELLRIFERLFLDWVLAPAPLLPGLNELDDDRCIEHHPSDEESTVLLCDGCEAKYNITRLNPPLQEVPKGDWYCPRCASGRTWADLDPRVGKALACRPAGEDSVEIGESVGRIENCLFRYPESKGSKPTFMYEVAFPCGRIETWSLEEVDRALSEANTAVPPIRCLEAVAESPGYGFGVDSGLRGDLIPVPMNPNISDSAAQVALSSSVFRDTIVASGTLLVIDPQEMTASEWLRLLVLLIMKCSSSDVIQNIVGTMESAAAEKMVAPLEKVGKISNIREVLPEIADHDDDAEADAKVKQEGPVENVELVVQPEIVNEVVTEEVSAEAVVAACTEEKSIAVVVEASAVEVVDEMDIDGVPAVVEEANLDVEVKEAVVEKPPTPFGAALAEKAKRQKAIEDSISGFCIKNQLRPSVASFGEDAVSQVVDSALSSKDPGLDFTSLRCRRMVCSFCSLTDVALGSPLVRVPNDDEWDDFIPHAARSRRTLLVAEIESTTAEPKGLVAVTIRVDGELVSIPETDFDEIVDGGMIEFAPRSEVGFQAELQFRHESGLPFVTGSLSAHECCAVAVHNSRKDNMVQSYKERQAELVENEAGMTCGRTLEIGRDNAQRSYWKFDTDPNALYVCSQAPGETATDSLVWHRYGEAESIASVVVSLGKEELVKDLKRSFPASRRMIKRGLWSNEILKRKFPRVAKIMEGQDASEDAEGAETEKETQLVDGGFEPYEVGEEVLVESKPAQLMWDAAVTAVSRRRLEGPNTGLLIDAYRIQYKGWSSRFIEWVKPNRVVEPSENNRLLQEEMLEEVAGSQPGLPTALNNLRAVQFLHARDRLRGSVPLPDFESVANVRVSKSSSEWTFGAMKAALLAVEAALPIGSIDHTESGVWHPSFAQKWRQMVRNARGPGTLMRCVILLEDTISEEWLKEDVGHLRTCLSSRWKALGEASPSGLTVRIILLDRAIMYGTVDRKRFGSKKKVGRPSGGGKNSK